MNKTALIGLCFLCAFTEAKIFDVQLVEVWALLCCVGFVAYLTRARWVINGPGAIVDIVKPYLWFFGLVFAGSFLSLRLEFYPPADLGPLKAPPLASLVRFVQLVLAMSCTVVVAMLIRRHKDALRLAMAVFVWGAIINAAWAIVCALLLFYDIELPGVYTVGMIRLRGFFAEGGPFGVYMVGAIVMQFVRRYTFRAISDPTFAIQTIVLAIALVGAQSKAGIIVILLLIPYWLYLNGRFGFLAFLPILLVPIIATSDFYEGLNGYLHNYLAYEKVVKLRPEDPSLVMGRLMAATLLPRMVEHHPILGIGIGNYSLIRNDPNILQGLPAIQEWDLPGLGLLGYAAELGVPLAFFALWLYAAPVRASKGRDPWLRVLCAYPLLAGLLGVQITFAYPWIISGIALAAAASSPKVTAAAKRRSNREIDTKRIPALQYHLRNRKL